MIENCRGSRTERLLRPAGLAPFLVVSFVLIWVGVSADSFGLDFDLPDTSTRLPIFREALGEAYAQAQEAEGLDRLAGLLYANGYLREAGVCYGHLRRLEPQEARWSYFLGMIDSELGDTNQAILDFEQARENAPDYLPTYLQLGNLLFKSGEVDRSEENFRRVLRDRPTDVYALVGIARCQMARSSWEESAATLEAAVGQEPRMTTTYALLAKAYMRLGKKEAAAEAREAAKNSPRYRNPADPWLDALNEYCYDPGRLAVLADVQTQAHNYDEAIPILNQALRIDPTNSACLVALGNVYEKTGREQEAEAQYRRAIAEDPDGDEGYLRLSALLLTGGDPQSALTYAEEGARRKPDSTLILNQLGSVLTEMGNTRAAEQAFRRSLAIDPVNRFALGKLGLLLFEQEPEEGLKWLNEYIRVQPDDYEVRFKVGDWYANREQFKEALSYLEPAFRFEKKNPELRRALSISYLRIGLDFAADSKLAEAIRELERALEVDPTFGDALFNISLLYMETDQASRAIAPLERYIADNRNDGEAWFHLARALALNDQFDSAQDVLRTGMEIARTAGADPYLVREMNALQKAIESHVED